MAAAKYISDSSGILTEVAGVQVGGAGSADKIVALNASTGLLDISMMPVGIGAEVTSAATSATIPAGHFVNLHNSAGLAARPALCTAASTAAVGFCLALYTHPTTAVVYGISNTNNAIPTISMTIGNIYWLSATSGQVSAASPGTASHIVQRLGVAQATGTLIFDNCDYWVKA